MGCAYADGCFTPEQTVLAAYWRGRSILDTELVPGQMAAVGLSWEECQQRLPKDVIPACHNSADSVTVSTLYFNYFCISSVNIFNCLDYLNI